MNVSFFLKDPKAKTPQRVFAYVRLNGKQLKVYTKVSVLPNQWSKAKQRVKASYRDATTCNLHLSFVETELKRAYESLIRDRIDATPQTLRARYEEQTEPGGKGQGGKSEIGFFDRWNQYEEEAKTTKSLATIRQYQSFRRKLKAFEDRRGVPITFDSITPEFLEEFRRFLLNVYHLQNSSIWVAFKNVKAFMAWANKKGYTDNQNARKANQRVVWPKVVRLTKDELRTLAECDLSDSPSIENIRNLFVLQCYLGCRVKDLLRIVNNPHQYTEGDVIRIDAGKTNKELIIPILPPAHAILFGPNPPYRIAPPNILIGIKEAAKRAGLNRPISKTIHRGNERKEVVKPLYECISSHWAKRTFVSLAIFGGLNIETVMKITGNSRATISRYIGTDSEEMQREVRKLADALS